jgi:DNA-binding MarR family transcriptional regulator
MSDDASAAIRRALSRQALAAARHRSAVARLLRISESEVQAIQLLALVGRLTPTALGSHLALTSGGTTALVQRLERAGRVARAAHPQDGRSRLLELTPTGEDEALEAFAPLVAELDRIGSELAEPEREVVRRFLGRVADAAERHAAGALRAVDLRARAGIGEPVPGLWA